MQEGKGLHNFHQRKRMHLKKEPYPHPDKWKRRLDKIVYVVGIFVIIMTIPQIWKIWVGKNAAGVSIISWGAYLVGAVFWMIYGIMHEEKPIIFTYFIWVILYLLILIGALIYN